MSGEGTHGTTTADENVGGDVSAGLTTPASPTSSGPIANNSIPNGGTSWAASSHEATIAHGNLSPKKSASSSFGSVNGGEKEKSILAKGEPNSFPVIPPVDVDDDEEEINQCRVQQEIVSGRKNGEEIDVEWPADPTRYKLLGRIGRGAFASVWRGEVSGDDMHFQRRRDAVSGCDATNEGEIASTRSKFCAIKILDLEHVDVNFVDIRQEVQTMRLSSHPNVLPCHASFICRSDLWLVTPLMDRGSSLHCLREARRERRRRRAAKRENGDSLRAGAEGGLFEDGDVIEPVFEDHITYILHETLLGLQYIHEGGQIHRDVKAGNVLVDGNGRVRIADFGVSGWLVRSGSRRENARTFVGTPCWMAPEVMEQVHGYDYKADIWSLGITALELAKGRAPYATYPPMKVLLMTIQEEPPSFETYQEGDEDKWSKSFQSMIQLCLQKNPQKRPNCEELLSHKHFQRFEDQESREANRNKFKVEVCDVIQQVGTSGNDSAGKQNNMPGAGPIYVVSSTEESNSQQHPAGTSWIFSDGSQVLVSSLNNSRDGVGSNDDDDDDKHAFFDEFERQTQGENFSSKNNFDLVGTSNVAGPSQQESSADNEDDINEFFDEFEKIPGGEHYRKPAP